MNYPMKRIQDIDRILERLPKIEARAFGAGIRIEITVGGDDEIPADMTIELCNNLDGVFAAIKDGLLESRKLQVISVRRDAAELQEFVSKLDK